MEKKLNINKLYFGVKLYPVLCRDKSELKELDTFNLFDLSRVKWSVARYVTMTEKEKKSLLSDPLHFCFGDTWGRCEYEFVVCPWGGLDENDKVLEVGIKVDTFEMYVKPNADLLMDMVNRVSISSAKEYLRDERKKFKRL